MKRAEFEDKLRQLRCATTIGRARMLIDELRDGASRVDALLREDFQRAVEEVGLPSPKFASVRLLPGETWLLLYEAPQSGCAVRLRASLDASIGDDRLGAEVRRAHRGLLNTAARACRRLEQPTPPTIEPDAPYGKFEIEGSSLGLSVAVATLSARLNRSPSTDVAGSAQVCEDGRLRPVEHLAEKLEALHQSWPEVARVVVATGQELRAGYRSPVELDEREHLGDAIPLFGLSLEALPHARLDDYRVRVSRFRADNAEPHDASEWERLSSVAWETSAALAADDPDKSAEAALWSALFAIHAGDPAAADALLRCVPEEITKEFPELLVRKLITSASNQIDMGKLDDAVSLAERAVSLCATVSARDRRELFGQALGTHGRALMHKGRFDAAEPLLRRALEHHRAQVPAEAPRSECYLATCLRLGDRPEEALRLVDHALTVTDEHAAKWQVAVTTRLFLRLERARISAALGRWEEATNDFVVVRDGQLVDTSYPRLGAVRGLARALRFLGRTDEADRALEACLTVVRQAADNNPVLQRVAAMAAGEALLDNIPSRSRAELEVVWDSVFPRETNAERIEAIVRSWVY